MKTYWDLSERARAELTDEELRRFEGVELMNAGVLEPEKPRLEPVPEAPGPDDDVFVIKPDGYSELDVAFTSEEDARAFLKLKPLRLGAEYFGGDGNLPVVHPMDEPVIAIKRVYTKAAMVANRETVKLAQQVRARNMQAEREYEKERAERDKAVEELRRDFFRCRTLAARVDRIAETYEAYVETAEGNRRVALGFLRKAFPEPEILQACAWDRIELPSGITADVENERFVEAPEALPAPEACIT